MIKIDEFDERILQILEERGNINNVDLAAEIGLSPSATLRRVQELERQEVITGYRAIIDHNKLGLNFRALILIGLSTHTKKSQQAFEKAVMKAPEVVEVHNITGTFEYLLKVETYELVDYKTFHTEVLGTLPQVHSIQTLVVLDSLK